LELWYIRGFEQESGVIGHLPLSDTITINFNKDNTYTGSSYGACNDHYYEYFGNYEFKPPNNLVIKSYTFDYYESYGDCGYTYFPSYIDILKNVRNYKLTNYLYIYADSSSKKLILKRNIP